MGRLDDKVSIITGATGGIGQVAIELFLREGSRVVASDLASREEARDKLDSHWDHDRLRYRRADANEPEEVQSLIDRAVNEFGGVNVLYNNHGIMVGKPFLETTLEEFDRVTETNLRSVFLLSRMVAKQMVEQGEGGSIINTSSVGGIIGFPNMAAYGAAKGGVANLSRSMANDLSDHRIRVNAICPGVIDTPMPHNYMDQQGMSEEEQEAYWEEMEQMHLLGRVGTPEEVVWLSLFLASDESSFMTGAVLPVDGGLSAV